MKLRTIDIDFLNTKPNGTRGFYPRDMFKEMVEEVQTSLTRVDLAFIQEEAVKAVRRIDDPIVWVFCDGCHCEDCVRGETKAYGERLVPGGWLLYHDCGEQYRDYPPDQKYHGGAKRAFHVIEFVKDDEYLEREFDLVTITPPRRRREGWYGGIYAYQKKMGVSQ